MSLVPINGKLTHLQNAPCVSQNSFHSFGYRLCFKFLISTIGSLKNIHLPCKNTFPDIQMANLSYKPVLRHLHTRPSLRIVYVRRWPKTVPRLFLSQSILNLKFCHWNPLQFLVPGTILFILNCSKRTYLIYRISKTIENLASLLFQWQSQENLGLGLYRPELASRSLGQFTSSLRGSVLSFIKGE